jgi:hypothetical protein
LHLSSDNVSQQQLAEAREHVKVAAKNANESLDFISSTLQNLISIAPILEQVSLRLHGQDPYADLRQQGATFKDLTLCVDGKSDIPLLLKEQNAIMNDDGLACIKCGEIFPAVEDPRLHINTCTRSAQQPNKEAQPPTMERKGGGGEGSLQDQITSVPGPPKTQHASAKYDDGPTQLLDDRGEENLRIYRELVGITNSTTYNSHRRPRWSLRSLLLTTSPTNQGYYQAAIDEEWKASLCWHFLQLFVNIIYLIQICVAVILTALSATRKVQYQTAVIVLAALLTVISGFTIYCRGRPTRYKRSRDNFRHVREYIEYVERKFRLPQSPDRKLEPWLEAETVKLMYEDTQMHERRRYSDLYVEDAQPAPLSRMTKPVESTGAASMGKRPADEEAGVMGSLPIWEP